MPRPLLVGGSIRLHGLGPKPKIPYCTAGMVKKIKLLISLGSDWPVGLSLFYISMRCGVDFA